MAEYLLFLAKVITILVAIVLFLLFLVSLRAGQAGSNKQSGRIEFEDLSEKYRAIKTSLMELIGRESETEDETTSSSTKRWWQFWKRKPKKSEEPTKNNLYIINFDGDVAASAVNGLREEITAILQVAKKEDEVLVKLKSPGGVVNGYGLAASQLVRVRDAGIHLTVAVDEVAASGGYLMACVANKIIAAPFAIVGSVGVVAQLPNFHKLLERFDIDYEQFTAGEYKRTVTMFGENDDEGRQKFRAELESIHHIFKQFVSRFRPDLDIDKIATGEHWLSVEAEELGLVDELKTSDSYFNEKIDIMNVYSVTYVEKKSIRKGIFRFFSKLNSRLNW